MFSILAFILFNLNIFTTKTEDQSSTLKENIESHRDEYQSTSLQCTSTVHGNIRNEGDNLGVEGDDVVPGIPQNNTDSSEETDEEPLSAVFGDVNDELDLEISGVVTGNGDSLELPNNKDADPNEENDKVDLSDACMEELVTAIVEKIKVGSETNNN